MIREEVALLVALIGDAASREGFADCSVRRGAADQPEVLCEQGEQADTLLLLMPRREMPAFVEYGYRDPGSLRWTIVDRVRAPAIIGATEFLAWFTQTAVGLNRPVDRQLRTELLGEVDVTAVAFADLEAILLSEKTPILERRLAWLAITEATTLQERIQASRLSGPYLRVVDRFLVFAEDAHSRAGKRWSNEVNAYAVRRYIENATRQNGGEVSRFLTRMEHSGLIRLGNAAFHSRSDNGTSQRQQVFRIEDWARLGLLAGLSRQRAAIDVVDAREWVWSRIRTGAALSARNAALDLLLQFPQDPELVYLAALAMARLGARDEASEMLGKLIEDKDRAPSRPELERLVHALGGSAELTDDEPKWSYLFSEGRAGGEDRQAKLRLLVRDIVALSARIEKDAFAAAPRASAEAMARARRAFEGYKALSNWRPDDHYPAVNAAAMAALLGDQDAAASYASRAEIASASDTSYWGAASLAEALLIAGRTEEAVTAARQSARLARASDVGGDVASTRRQLKLLVERFPDAHRVAEQLPNLATVAFSGHMIPADMPATEASRHEAAMIEDLEQIYASQSIGTLFTALARGADIASAKAALQATEAKVALHVVLPFDPVQFRKHSVSVRKRTGEREWGKDFDDLIARAAAITVVCRKPMPEADRWAAIVVGNEVITGLALLHSDQQASERCLLVAVSAGGSPSSPEGTVALVNEWERHGLPVIVRPCGWRQPLSGDAPRKLPLPFQVLASIRAASMGINTDAILGAMPAGVSVVSRSGEGIDVSMPASGEALSVLAGLAHRHDLRCFADYVHVRGGVVSPKATDDFPEAAAIPPGTLLTTDTLAAVARFRFHRMVDVSPIGIRERDRKGQKGVRDLAPSQPVYRLTPAIA